MLCWFSGLMHGWRVFSEQSSVGMSGTNGVVVSSGGGGGDPRRPNKIVRYKPPSSAENSAGGGGGIDDPIADYMNLLGMVFSMCGLMMKLKWCAWVAVYCAFISFANSRQVAFLNHSTTASYTSMQPQPICMNEIVTTVEQTKHVETFLRSTD